MVIVRVKLVVLLICCNLFMARPILAQTDLTQAKKDYNEGNYPLSLDAAVLVYHTAHENNDEAAIADAGNLIGLIRLAQSQPRLAIKFLREAASLNQKINNEHRSAANYINLGLAFTDLFKPDSAVHYLQMALSLSASIKADDLVAMARNHLGDAYFKKNDFLAAEQQYLAVINNNNYKSDWENSFAYTGLARLRNQQRQYREASKFADMAFELAKKAGTKWDATQALELAHSAYRSLGDPSTAYDRLLLYKRYSDSLVDLEKQKALNGLFLKERSFDNDRLLKQREIDRLVIVVISLIALIILLTAFVFYRKIVRTRRINRQLSAQNEAVLEENHDKDRLFSIVSHDLRSPLAGLHSTLQLFRSGELDAEELVSLADQMSVQLEGTSGMLDSLLVWAGKQLGGIKPKPVHIYLPAKIEKITAAFAPVAARKNIQLVHEPQKLPTILGDADQIRIILQNLIANAIKYTPVAGVVSITYSLDDHVNLFIADNGVGMQSEDLHKILSHQGLNVSSYGTANEKGIGLGMQLAKEFAMQNNVTLTGQSEPGKGTTFHLKFVIS